MNGPNDSPRKAYDFELCDGSTGKYITEAHTMAQVKNELLDMYGKRLYAVQGEVLNGRVKAPR